MEILNYPMVFQYVVDGKSTSLSRLPCDDLQRVIRLITYLQNDGSFKLHNMNIGVNPDTANLLSIEEHELYGWFNRMFRRRVLQKMGDDIGLYRGVMNPDNTIEENPDAHYFYLRRNLLADMCEMTFDSGVSLKIFFNILPCIHCDTQILYKVDQYGHQTNQVLTIEDLLKVVHFKHDLYGMSELFRIVAMTTAACKNGTADFLFNFESKTLNNNVRWNLLDVNSSKLQKKDLDFRTHYWGSWERGLIDSREIIRLCRSPIAVNSKVYSVKEG